jgi:threonine dehydrogenase-like Zn-dependent dehydrogenase
VPDVVDDERAVFAEPLAAALHVLDDVPSHAERAVVIGDGKLGQLVALSLATSMKRVTMIGHHEQKLAIARAAGIETVLESDVDGSAGNAPVVVDATGSQGGLALALRLAEPRGTVILKTTVAGATSADLAPIVIKELRVVGSRCGDLQRAVRALSDRRVDPSSLIAARFPLSAADAALAHASRPGVLKVLVTG